MRGSAAVTNGARHRTIDLTTGEPRVLERPVSRRMRDGAARDRALAAFRSMRRRRRLHAAVDALADATMATGGLTLANVSLKLNLGLPNGIAGIALGIALLGLGAAIAIRHRSPRGGTDPASAATPARTIVLDEPVEIVTLDLSSEHHAA